MHAVGLFSSQLNPESPVARPSSHAIREGDEVDIMTDAGEVIGTAKVVGIGSEARFHHSIVGPSHAVVAGFLISNARAAERQLAWLSDTDAVVASQTPLSSISANILFAVPVTCIRQRQ